MKIVNKKNLHKHKYKIAFIAFLCFCFFAIVFFSLGKPLQVSGDQVHYGCINGAGQCGVIDSPNNLNGCTGPNDICNFYCTELTKICLIGVHAADNSGCNDSLQAKACPEKHYGCSALGQSGQMCVEINGPTNNYGCTGPNDVCNFYCENGNMCSFGVHAADSSGCNSDLLTKDCPKKFYGCQNGSCQLIAGITANQNNCDSDNVGTECVYPCFPQDRKCSVIAQNGQFKTSLGCSANNIGSSCGGFHCDNEKKCVYDNEVGGDKDDCTSALNGKDCPVKKFYSCVSAKCQVDSNATEDSGGCNAGLDGKSCPGYRCVPDNSGSGGGKVCAQSSNTSFPLCGSDPNHPCSHLICNPEFKCAIADLPGDNECSVITTTRSTECQHLACNPNNQCVLVTGQGTDECSEETSGATTECQHLACSVQTKKCFWAPGAGENQGGCTALDATCGDETHNICNYDAQCVPVPGVGDDECTETTNCQHLRCSVQTKKCFYAAGKGIDLDGCTADGADCGHFPTRCVPTGSGTGGMACVESSDTAFPTCTNVADCSHLICSPTNQCALSPTPGTDECSEVTSGPTTECQHLVCSVQTKKCVYAPGAGSNQGGCTALDATCGNETHLICNYENKCVQVPGVGTDECSEVTSGPTTECQHLVCSVQTKKCVYAPGAGDPHDGCTAYDADCGHFPTRCVPTGSGTGGMACVESSDTTFPICTGNSSCNHFVCSPTNQCANSPTPGTDQCSEETSGATTECQHLACSVQTKKCFWAPGAGENQGGCTALDATCGDETHNICNYDAQCVPVPGVGDDECTETTNCQHLRCSVQTKKCFYAAGKGIDLDGCTADGADCGHFPTRCVPTGSGTGGMACVESSDTTFPICTGNPSCNHLICSPTNQCANSPTPGTDQCSEETSGPTTECQHLVCSVTSHQCFYASGAGDNQDGCTTVDADCTKSYYSCQNGTCAADSTITSNRDGCTSSGSLCCPASCSPACDINSTTPVCSCGVCTECPNLTCEASHYCQGSSAVSCPGVNGTGCTCTHDSTQCVSTACPTDGGGSTKECMTPWQNICAPGQISTPQHPCTPAGDQYVTFATQNGCFGGACGSEVTATDGTKCAASSQSVHQGCAHNPTCGNALCDCTVTTIVSGKCDMLTFEFSGRIAEACELPHIEVSCPRCGAGTGKCTGGSCVPDGGSCSSDSDCIDPTPVYHCDSNHTCVSGAGTTSCDIAFGDAGCIPNCTPDCSSGCGGGDGCGHTCGCPQGQTCSNGTCATECSTGGCTAGTCNVNDSCGNPCTCAPGQTCSGTTCTTACVPNDCSCAATIPASQTCTGNCGQTCTGTCVPDCYVYPPFTPPQYVCNKTGGDGCGGTCGCSAGQICQDNECKGPLCTSDGRCIIGGDTWTTLSCDMSLNTSGDKNATCKPTCNISRQCVIGGAGPECIISSDDPTAINEYCASLPTRCNALNQCLPSDNPDALACTSDTDCQGSCAGAGSCIQGGGGGFCSSGADCPAQCIGLNSCGIGNFGGNSCTDAASCAGGCSSSATCVPGGTGPSCSSDNDCGSHLECKGQKVVLVNTKGTDDASCYGKQVGDSCCNGSTSINGNAQDSRACANNGTCTGGVQWCTSDNNWGDCTGAQSHYLSTDPDTGFSYCNCADSGSSTCDEPGTPTPPYGLNVTSDDCAVAEGIPLPMGTGIVSFNWNFSVPSGYAFQKIVFQVTSGNWNNPVIDRTIGSSNNQTATIGLAGSSAELKYNTPYSWRVILYETSAYGSGDPIAPMSSESSYKNTGHPGPETIFTFSPTTPKAKDTVVFSGTASRCFSNSGPVSCSGYNWNFYNDKCDAQTDSIATSHDATTSYAWLTGRTKCASLTVSDGTQSCSTAQDIPVAAINGTIYPNYKEVSPFQ